MTKRRVSFAALSLSIAGALTPWTVAHADTPAPDTASAADPTAATADPAPADAPSDAPTAPDGTVAVGGDSYADTDPSALADFRPALDPYGAWVDDPAYGTVWSPNLAETGQDFAPYVSAGHWAYDGDFVWVSDYEWGWVTFHYGRWQWAGENGWIWIPGRAYAAAWVVWRMGEEEYGYIGWAPMPPAWVWQNGIAVGASFGAAPMFTFCAAGDVFAPAIAARVVAPEYAAALLPHTRPYVRASPVVRGRPLAQPILHGPPTAAIGIDPSRVVRSTNADHGALRAQLYARPSTALPLGAHRPVPHVVQPRPLPLPAYIIRPVVRAPRGR